MFGRRVQIYKSEYVLALVLMLRPILVVVKVLQTVGENAPAWMPIETWVSCRALAPSQRKTRKQTDRAIAEREALESGTSFMTAVLLDLKVGEKKNTDVSNLRTMMMTIINS
jgi:hypothetical protein